MCLQRAFAYGDDACAHNAHSPTGGTCPQRTTAEPPQGTCDCRRTAAGASKMKESDVPERPGVDFENVTLEYGQGDERTVALSVL